MRLSLQQFIKGLHAVVEFSVFRQRTGCAWSNLPQSIKVKAGRAVFSGFCCIVALRLHAVSSFARADLCQREASLGRAQGDWRCVRETSGSSGPLLLTVFGGSDARAGFFL